MDDTEYLQSLLDKGGNVVIPEGRYTTGPLFIRSCTDLVFEDGVELVASIDEECYPLIRTRLGGIWMKGYPAVLNAIDAENVSISGKAVIDGSGPYWWRKYWGDDFKGGYRGEYDSKGLRWAADYDCLRVRNVLVQNSRGIKIRDITSRNAGFWNIHICYCSNVIVENVFVDCADEHGPSTDGIDIDSSSDVTVRGCTVKTNDDSICIKSGRDADGWTESRPSHDILIEDCTVLSGFGVTIGSEVSGGIHDVTIKNMKYYGTDCGFRIKSARPRRGYIRNISVSDLEMTDVRYPIHICLDWNPLYSYCTLPEDYSGPVPDYWETLLSKIPDNVPDTILEDINIRGIRASIDDNMSVSGRAFNIEGYADQPIRRLSISDSKIEADEFGIISCVENLMFDDVSVTARGSYRKENDGYDNR